MLSSRHVPTLIYFVNTQDLKRIYVGDYVMVGAVPS